jgi:hypothetical protein
MARRWRYALGSLSLPSRLTESDLVFMCGYQLLFSRLFVAQLSLSFFIAPLPEQHKTDRCRAFVTRRPNKNWVGVREWKDVIVDDEGVYLDCASSASSSPKL